MEIYTIEKANIFFSLKGLKYKIENTFLQSCGTIHGLVLNWQRDQWQTLLLN